MENNYLISVVIPCYNDAQYIEQAVQSVLNQTYANIEVIIVDDGSNVATKAVLKKLEPKITKLVTQENQGQSKARNVGILQAKGDYILVLDSDDYFEPSFCEKAIEIILKNKKIKLVTCQANLFFEDGSSYVFIPKGGSIANFLYINDALGTSMFKKEDWLSCGCYDENMRLGYEDWEFFIRLLKTGGEVEVIQEPLYNYRKRDNTTSSKSKKIKYDLLKYIYIKHKDLYISDFDVFVSQLLFKIKREEIEKIKNTKRLEFQIGKAILSPLRSIKRLFR